MRKLLLSVFAWVMLFTLAHAQRTVSGKVTDDSGGTLPGVNVIIKGTTTGVTTDINGDYRISVDDGSTLIFSFVGFETQEILVGSRTTIDVTMSGVTELQEVIVTGYGDLSKDKLAGSTSSMGSAVIEQVPTSSFAQTLQGNLPGVLSTTGNGQPGETGRVLIRGPKSIQGSTDPLYVLDGIQIEAGTFATLNQNDFESVTVLKDAAAAAIYGSRGANGVIVIKSKRGRLGEKTQFNYRFQRGWSTATTDFFGMMNTEEKIARELETGQGFVGGLASSLASGSISQEFYNATLDSIRGNDTNWKDVLFSTGKLESHEVNASGGTENSRYFVSLNYFNQEGLTVGSGLERYTLRFNVDNEASDKFRWGTSNSLGFSRTQSLGGRTGLTTQNPFLAAFLLNPYDLPRDPNTGEFAQPSQGLNVLDIATETNNNRDEVKIISSVYLEYDIIDGLKARTSWGMDFRQRYFRNSIEPFPSSGVNTPNDQGELFVEYNRRPSFTGTNSLSYSKTFGDDHNLTVGLFHEIWYQRFENFNATLFGFDRILDPDGATPGTDANGFIPETEGRTFDESILSYFANVNYDFKGKYFVNATVRRDGSSRFGANNRFATFWAVGSTWRISDEDFFDVGFVNNLSLRASYGTTGNKEVGFFANGDENYYPSLGTYGSTAYNGLNALFPLTPSNPDLRWETTAKANIGLDFVLGDGRFSGTVELYREETTDLFIEQNLSRTTGFTSLDVNSGTMTNKGIDLTLSADVIRSNDLTVNLFANISYNRNEITDLGQVDEFEQGTSIIRVGEPLGSHFITGYAGVDPANGAPLYLDTLGNVTTTYSAANYTTGWGTDIAPHFGGFGTKVNYKGFSMNALFSYVAGHAIFNNDRFFLENPNFAGFNQSRAVLRAWKQPGDITDVPGNNYPVNFSSRHIEDGTFLRLRNVVVSYNIPQDLIKSVSLRSCRIYVQGQNLLTWTKFQGFDPELSNNIVQGIYPAARTYTVGVDIGF